jgi:hypothetical protein
MKIMTAENDLFPNRRFVDITAYNAGRTAVEIRQCGFRISGSDEAIAAVSPLGPRIPHKLDPGHAASWSVEEGEIRQVASSTEVDKLVPYVSLGTGKTRTGKAIRLGAAN